MTTKTAKQYNNTSLLLALDTSTAYLTVSLSRGDRLLGEITSRAERNHSLYLVPTIDRLLADSGVAPSELGAVAVGVGPGSYTGVRIGVTVAKTLAWSGQLPLTGVSTLETLALGAVSQPIGGVAPADSPTADVAPIVDGTLDAVPTLIRRAQETAETVWVVPLLDARRGQAFTSLFEGNASEWTRLAPDGIRLMSVWTEELVRLVEERKPDSILFTGEPELHSEAIRALESRWSGSVKQGAYGIHARHVGELARIRFERGETEDVYGLVPNYTQLAEAEAKLLAKGP